MTIQDAPGAQDAGVEDGAAAPQRARLLEIVDQLRSARQRTFRFLLAGRTGVGKSSLVNSLMGQPVATVSDYEPATAQVEVYESQVDGIAYAVADTPGLCDDLPEVGNDERYLELIRERVPEVDCMWFVTRLDDSRVSSDEKRGIALITQAFGPRVWSRAVLVFTFANNVAPERYAQALQRRAELIREEVARHAGEKAARGIPAVAADNLAPTTPDGEPWLGELYTTVFERISRSGALPFLLATASRIDTGDAPPPADGWQGGPAAGGEPPRITLNDDQRERISRRIDAEIIPAMAALGITAGALFGPVGAAVGGVLGAAVGLLAWLKK
ncbi:MAG TPA: GTPase [Longimicrobium sp.]|nr:GTPase [Longimicrobium sp.]